jgi:hypothetical protein
MHSHRLPEGERLLRINAVLETTRMPPDAGVREAAWQAIQRSDR